MIKIAYISSEQNSEFSGQLYSACGIFTPIQDDVSGAYYITEYEIMNATSGDFLWLHSLDLVDLPETEKYKFKFTE